MTVFDPIDRSPGVATLSRDKETLDPVLICAFYQRDLFARERDCRVQFGRSAQGSEARLPDVYGGDSF